MARARHSGNRNRHKSSSQPGEDAAEIVADGGEDDVGGIVGAAFEIAAAEVTFGLQVADAASSPPMHHRIMVRSERESTNEIARFGSSSAKSLQSQMPPHPKNRLPLNRLEACSRTTVWPRGNDFVVANPAYLQRVDVARQDLASNINPEV